jgi:hypothetical protein
MCKDKDARRSRGASLFVGQYSVVMLGILPDNVVSFLLLSICDGRNYDYR